MKKVMVMLLITTFFTSCKDQTDYYVVEEKSLNEAVYASGEIYPAEYEYLFVGTPVRVMKILAEEEASVKAGDILVILGTASENTQVDILIDQVAIARQNTQEHEAILTELREKIRLSLSKYRQDSINAQRYQELTRDKAVSDKDAEQARIQAETSFTEHSSLQNQYTASRNDLRNQLLSAEKELAALRQSREGKILSSNIRGKVYSINLREGELANPDEPILLIGSKDSFKLELLVDERDISKIELGQKVYFETDAFSERQFEAEITKIVPVLQRNTRSFEVEAKVLDKHRFFPQSSVEANILIRKNAKVLLVPIDYLLDGDSLNISKEDQVHKTKVVIGTRQNDWVEIREGLDPGDVIIKND